MKRVKDREQALRVASSRERRRARRIKRLEARRSRPSYSPKLLEDEILLDCPVEVSLDNVDPHDEVVAFLIRLRQAVASGSPVCINFYQARKMVAGGTLLLFSELHRLKEMYPATPIRCLPPKDNTVHQVLKHLRILELLGYASDVVPTRPDVVSWRMASSSRVDGTKIGTILTAYRSLDGVRARQLFRGATEAMVNVTNHAYLDTRDDGLPRPPEEKWWMFCMEKEDRVVVAICDLGIGIPRSLPALYAPERIAKAISKLAPGAVQSDSMMIDAAMVVRRTRTKNAGRGRGLKDLKRLVEEVDGSSLFIFSNKGLVRYAGGQSFRRNYHLSIKGTIVVWVVPLSGEENV